MAKRKIQKTPEQILKQFIENKNKLDFTKNHREELRKFGVLNRKGDRTLKKYYCRYDNELSRLATEYLEAAGGKMTDKFNRCIGTILQHEGGYVNNPNDPGGETNMGISKRSYPKEDIKNMTIGRAKEIYFRDYWTPCGCENIGDIKLALALFDSAVNCGVGTALKWLIPNCTLKGYTFRRLSYYFAIVQKNPKLQEFLRNWFDRSMDCLEANI